MNFGHYAEVVAREKVGITNWKAYLWRVLDRNSGIFWLKGGVPKKIQIGKRKGENNWRGVPTNVVYVTKQECEAAYAKYEADTGNCGECLGGGKILRSAHINGTRIYDACPKCSGTRRNER